MYEVTIVIPIYQVENYIKDTLLQALNQSFNSIEYLIIDDCGTDKSLQIVHFIKDTHHRGTDIRIICCEQNKGIAYVRNLAIEQACGRFIYFLDGDDGIADNCIQILYDYAIKYNTDFTTASYQTINIDGCKEYHLYKEQYINGIDTLASLHYNTRNGLIFTSMWNKLYRTEWLRKNHIKCIPGMIHEEPDFIIQLISHTRSCYLLPQITYFYNQRVDSITKKQRTFIPINEVENHIKSLSFRKEYALTLKAKTYFPSLALFLIKSSFNDASLYVSAKIFPKFNNNHLKQVLLLPFNLQDILTFKYNKIRVLSYYIINIFPLPIQRLFFQGTGKYKRFKWNLKKVINKQI